jgi:hypothetical protein
MRNSILFLSQELLARIVERCGRLIRGAKFNKLRSIHVVKLMPLQQLNKISISVYYGQGGITPCYGAHTSHEISHHQSPVNENFQCKK